MSEIELVGVGNAIVDVISQASEDFIQQLRLNKGTMTLVDAEQAEKIYNRMGPGLEMSGGSAANTLAGFASLGGRGGYIGKVANDQLGEVFRHDIQSIGVRYDTAPLENHDPTARCLVLVTPDAERTMCTYLGASPWLAPEDLNKNMISEAAITYLEGYLFDRTRAQQAFRTAAQVAHAAGKKVALTLSDPFCVERHRDAFLDLVSDHIDILFANEKEIKSLYQVDTFEKAAERVKGHCEVACLTRSEKGSLILSGDNSFDIAAAKPERIADTTGAGDLYAAGFLFGYIRNRPLPECGHIASVCAAEVLAHMGARPEKNLADLIKDKAA